MGITTSSFDKNIPSTWASAEVYSPPSSFDVAGYQTKIDEILGLSETNRPIVRLVWAGDRQKCYSKFAAGWNADGSAAIWETRAKYKYASLQVPGTGSDIIDIPPPRWVFEQFNHPGQYEATWHATRFVDGREQRPGPPEGGYYSELYTIAHHGDFKCCEKVAQEKMVCWGMYREPDEKDLQILREAKFKREADRFVDPAKPLDAKTLDILGKQTAEEIAKRDAEIEAEVAEYIDEHAFELIEAATGQKVPESLRKQFSIPALPGGVETTGSGLVIPRGH